MEGEGLTTAEALQRLHNDIEEALKQEEQSHIAQKGSLRDRPLFRLLLSSLQIWEPLCTFNWISLSALLLEMLALIIAYFSQYPDQSHTLLWHLLVLTFLTLFNVLFACWDMRLRKTEMKSRVRWLLNVLDEWKHKCVWKPENYPHIHSPQSPSITLQPTLRDNHVVNLPWALLVKGDIIILRPGHSAPGRCRSLRISNGNQSNFVLEADEVYAPLTETGKPESFSSPQIRRPLPCAYCILEETPYVHSVRITLREALNRPISILHKEKFLCFTVCLEQFVAPLFLVLLLVVNAAHYFYAADWLSAGHWTDMFLIQPCMVILPLLPLVLPVAWLFISAYGVALILALHYTARQFKVSNDPFEDAEVASPTHSSFWSKCKELRPFFLDTLLGRGKSPFRTENLFQTLASVTALCCIDKKGILSWPNPTAEKVFFLRNVKSKKLSELSEELASQESSPTHPKETRTSRRVRKRISKRNNSTSDRSYCGRETKAEVLDLSHDYTTPFRLQFDDPSWQQFMGSLKPLGLAVLLNTCNPATQERYAQFCAQLSCLSKFHEDFVPVTNRRDELESGRTSKSMCDSRQTYVASNTFVAHGCLCELAKQIGFQDAARSIFSLKDQLFTFRHQADPSSRKDRLARSLSMPKLKFPFPNMVGVCVEESTSGRLQLMSQGTGEILLDSCVDFWNGSDLCPLTMGDRKRILDFYNRSSLTAYCTAFAYRPIERRHRRSAKMGNEKMFCTADTYLELPPDSSHLYQPQRSPTPVASVSLSRIHSDSNLCGYNFRSNESLIPESPEDRDPDSPESYFQMQCNQTFVGMVTMQYQARTDMVQLIEQLDKACIRFVHFSKENELRSRVFSEKMGLESGWNCHISLMNEDRNEEDKDELNEEQPMRKRQKSLMSLANNRDDVMCAKSAQLEHCRPLSVSAPSAINVDVAQVKFEDEISLHNLTDDDSDADRSDTDLLQAERLKVKSSSAGCHTPSPQRLHTAHNSMDSSLDACSTSSSSSSSSVLLNVVGGGSSCWDVNLSRSQSHVTESTEQSAPVAFDLSNRAKLPRGIDEIRPHIENVDNVPLLVSLFTESTPAATREMIKIMQEYGEVVCIVGSSASAYNCAIFMQADASLAVEPLYPQVCQKVPVVSPPEELGMMSPVELSRRLNSLPCALSFHRDELSSLLHLILESRHVGFCLQNVLQFWASSIAALSAVQLGGALLFLPPIMSFGQVIWLSCFTIPVVSVSLMGAPTDSSVMNTATGKNSRKIDKGTFSFAMWNYGLKFIPSMFILLIVHGASLYSWCDRFASGCQSTDECSWVYPTSNGTAVPGLWSGWDDPGHRQYLYSIQHTTSLAFVVFLVLISVCFVHRQHHFWQENPLNNRLWIVCSSLVIIAQAVYFSWTVPVFSDAESDASCHSHEDSMALPLPAWFLLVWSAPLIGLNEVIKHYEIKVNVRAQKRARLEFGTKLGMNSPF